MSASALLLVALLPLQEQVVVDRDDVVLDRDCVVVVGAQVIRDANGDGVVHVRTPGITIDFDGAHLVGAPFEDAPDTHAGIGISIQAPGVTLRNAAVSGFKVGILARESDGLTLENCALSWNYRQRLGSTPEVEDPADWLWPHDNDAQEWRTKYGAGICIERSIGVRVDGCFARDVQNGLILDRVTDSVIWGNDLSFLSGWGIAMWRSSDNEISSNKLEFCIRGYSHDVYNRGQDSAGLLMFEQCSRNTINHNSITHGGDGIFGFAGKEALGDVPAPEGFDHVRKGCNDNLFVDNDLSYAAAHGLEVTFGFGNRIERNRFVENAICGIWGGYSADSWIMANEFVGNGGAGYGAERGGINIEHGRRNVVYMNEFLDNAVGVRLWWDDDRGLLDSAWVRANGAGCEGNVLSKNTIRGGEIGIQLRSCSGTAVEDNEFEDVATPRDYDAPPDGDASAWTVNRPRGRDEFRRVDGRWEDRTHLRGREHIVMTEWGPYDWQRPLLQPLPRAGAADVWRWLGDVALASIEALGEVEVALDRSGEHPRLEVRSTSEAAVVPYELLARIDGGEVRVTGELTDLRWAVRCFAWTVDPREDEAGWRREAEGAVAFEVAELDLAFGMQGPSQLSVADAGLASAGLPTERFGTLAETRARLPAGRWELRVTSDDGVRVWADGEVAYEDWSWHGPKTESAFLDLDGAREVRLQVEHFELDGYAVLKLELRRAR